MRAACLQPLQAFVNMLQSALNLSTLASDEQVHAIMLAFQIAKEGAPKSLLTRIALAWDRQRLASSRCCLMFDEIFEVVVINVV